jgi:predicted nucleotidyltransferase
MPDRSNVILQGVVGSTAYGLAHEDSDIDKAGVYVAPTHDVLGLSGPEVVKDSLQEHKPDRTLHEVGKFVGLALAANPSILELLFLPAYEVLTDEGDMLVEHRQVFLSSKNIKARYGGYAKSQADRLLQRENDGKEGFSSDTKARTEKHGRHCYRLLFQAEELLRTGQLQVNVADKRDEIFDMGRLAATDPEGFHRRALARIEAVDNIDSILPYEPNRIFANDMLVGIRVRFLS